MTSTTSKLAQATAGGWLLWSGAAAIALSAHIGAGALTLWRNEAPDLDDLPPGSIVMELAPILTSPTTATVSPTIGPASEDSVASQPQVVSKPPEPLEQEVPIAEPSPTIPEPDLAVPERPPESKAVAEVKPDLPTPETSRDAPAEMSVASQAMAPPKIEAPAAPKSAAPEIGLSPRAARAKVTWHQSIAAHLNRFKRYPSDARGQDAKGEVLLQFSTDRAGRVLAASVVRTSGSEVLDTEALAMLRRAAPLPLPSADVAGETFTLTVPVVYRQR